MKQTTDKGVYAAIGFVSIVLILLYGILWQWWLKGSDLAAAARTGNAGDHTLGFIFLLIAIFIGFISVKEYSWVPKWLSLTVAGILALLFIVLSVFAYCGWFAGVY